MDNSATQVCVSVCIGFSVVFDVLCTRGKTVSARTEGAPTAVCARSTGSVGRLETRGGAVHRGRKRPVGRSCTMRVYAYTYRRCPVVAAAGNVVVVMAVVLVVTTAALISIKVLCRAYGRRRKF